MSKIFFLPVSTPLEKKIKIVNCIQRHFSNGEKILVRVSSQESADYVDKMLWAHPAESFLPHMIAQNDSDERIAITMSHENVNHATILINLSGSCCQTPEQYEMIWELYDRSEPSKEALSQEKMNAYQSREIAVTVYE